MAKRLRFSILVFSLLFLFSYFWSWSIAVRYAAAVSKIEATLTFGEWLAAAAPSRPLLTGSLHPILNAGNRSFTFNPVTADESVVLTKLDQSGITAAVCHRTLFGNKISLDPLFAFVSYYRLLGFDHIFFWCRPNIASLSRFDELSSLPYVTMTEYTGGGREDGQDVVEEECMSNSTFASNYDWALVIDGDEYLWINSQMSIKEFLSIYDSNYTFLSFGKWIYTMLNRVEIDEDSGFGLDSFAFTAESYCNHNFSDEKIPFKYPRNMTYSWCPSSRGRSKVLAKPGYHNKVNIHGQGFDFMAPGLMHFDTSIVHFKEWRSTLMKQKRKASYSPPVDFNVSEHKEVDLLMFKRAYKWVDGKVLMHYDSGLQDWMRFVASGCSNGNLIKYVRP